MFLCIFIELLFSLFQGIYALISKIYFSFTSKSGSSPPRLFSYKEAKDPKISLPKSRKKNKVPRAQINNANQHNVRASDNQSNELNRIEKNNNNNIKININFNDGEKLSEKPPENIINIDIDNKIEHINYPNSNAKAIFSIEQILDDINKEKNAQIKRKPTPTFLNSNREEVKEFKELKEKEKEKEKETEKEKEKEKEKEIGIHIPHKLRNLNKNKELRKIKIKLKNDQINNEKEIQNFIMNRPIEKNFLSPQNIKNKNIEQIEQKLFYPHINIDENVGIERINRLQKELNLLTENSKVEDNKMLKNPILAQNLKLSELYKSLHLDQSKSRSNLGNVFQRDIELERVHKEIRKNNDLIKSGNEYSLLTQAPANNSLFDNKYPFENPKRNTLKHLDKFKDQFSGLHALNKNVEDVLNKNIQIFRHLKNQILTNKSQQNNSIINPNLSQHNYDNELRSEDENNQSNNIDYNNTYNRIANRNPNNANS